MSSTISAPTEEKLPVPRPAMRENETLSFLRKNKVKKFDESVWRPHQPLLFVFPNHLLISLFGSPETLKPYMRPSLGRIDNPTEVVPGGLRCKGQVDYYAIDPDTYQLFIVRTSVRDKNYDIQSRALFFLAADHLFPKGPPPDEGK